MTTWHTFPWWLAAVSLCWLPVCLPAVRRPAWWIAAGTLLLAVFVGGLWQHLDRPPLRTLGETRLWFGLLLPVCALGLYRFVPWRWPLIYTAGLALLFLGITALQPATHDRTLMPALQSPWFVPHVVLYLLAYALLFYAAIFAALAWWRGRRDVVVAATALVPAEVALWLGFAFLTLGLLAGAVWAKVAWGHYWTWDPKETWAFLTWATYLVYLHLRPTWQAAPRQAAAYLTLASVMVLACWFGVNYLPSAQQSVHTYSS